MADEPIIVIEALTHRFGSRVALDNVTFDVPPGSIFALLGPNGGGKSTLFRIVATLLNPSEGAARVGGADVVTQRDRVRHMLGIAFQNPSLDGKLTVLENLRHQGHLYGLSGGSLTARSVQLLERFGVMDRAGDRAETLSGGLQRRVELAKALLHEPQVLILDEPSAGLDPGARSALMDHLHELRDQDGVTTLITTHLMDEADRCDRIGILDLGGLVALDTPAALKSAIGGDVLTVHTADPSRLGGMVKEQLGISTEVVDGVVRIERERGHEFVAELIEAFPGEIASVTVGRPTLADVFVHLTGHRLWGGEEDNKKERKV